ncbi:hypothetical protein HPB50_017238 [Hyalomma asiaticum]|uniref:Uncharacterized protein n=1 Tax=Hyalomma asiaticum TaxID=266040 RepID=A0ACB7TLY6_HYAAI|nr:hypothetical protein HPB50_017238 [Hyalomma asiaticum]
MNRRNQYTAAFKKRVILLAEERGNSSAARHLGLTESTVRSWRECRDCIFQAAPTRKAFRGTKNGHFAKIEEDLAEFVRQRRGQFLPANADLVQINARDFAREAGVLHDSFKDSRLWVQKFMGRTRFSLRRRTLICQKLPAEYEKLIEFQRYVMKMRRERQYPIGQNGNADETAIFLDVPAGYVIDELGNKEVRVHTTGNEKTRVMVMLAAEKRERRARWHEARLQNSGQALCSPRLLDKREHLPGDTWCVPWYRGLQSRARSRVAEVPRSQVPVFGPLAGSRAAERCRAVPSGVRGSGAFRHGTDGAVLDGTATCNRHAWVFNEAPEAEVEPALFQASPGRRYRAKERETWSMGLLSPVSFPACHRVPCDESHTSLFRVNFHFVT